MAMIGLPNISRFIPFAIQSARAPAIRRPSVHWALLNFIFILFNLITKNTLLGIGERSVPGVTECHCFSTTPEHIQNWLQKYSIFSVYTKQDRKLFTYTISYNLSTGLPQSPISDYHIDDYRSADQRCYCTQRQKAALAGQLAHKITQKSHSTAKHHG